MIAWLAVAGKPECASIDMHRDYVVPDDAASVARSWLQTLVSATADKMRGMERDLRGAPDPEARASE